MIKASDLKREIVFTHFDPVTGKRTVFASQRLVAWCKAVDLETVRFPVDAEYARFCMHNRGTEDHRLARLGHAQLQEPVLVCHMPEDDTWLMVDGTHRYVRAWLEGYKHVSAWRLKEKQWRPYEVVGAPEVTEEQLRRSHSGIK